jgi:signal transduction histidine kinase
MWVGGRFPLLRFFGFLGLTAIVLAAIVLGSLYRLALTRTHETLAEYHNVEAILILKNAVWPEFSSFLLSTAEHLDRTALRNHPATARLTAAIQDAVKGVKTLKIKIFTPEGRVLFSTDTDQIGDDENANPRFQIARGGKIFSVQRRLERIAFFDRTIENRELLVTYVPLFGADGAVEAVFEMYFDLTAINVEIARSQWLAIAGVAAVLLILFGALVLIVRHADRVIARQDEANRRLAAAIDRTAAGVVIVEPGRQPTPVLYANSAFLGMAGCNEALVAVMARIRGEGPQGGELGVPGPDGTEKWYELQTSPADQPGSGGRCWIGVLVDISERKRAERMLRAARDEALRASRAKSEFLANMSHELRTPLNAVIGFAEAIEAKVLPPNRQDEYVAAIGQAGRHLLGLIGDILDISAIEAGKVAIKDEAVDVAETVGACLEVMEAQARKAEVRLSACVEPDLPPLTADSRRLRQIVLNLLSNAVKFTPAGGTVELSAGRGETGEMVLSVADTGIGMDEAGIALALAPFGQVESGLARRYQGAGLGLPLTEGLAKLHGGSLEIASRPGQGTTITVRFPAWRFGAPAFVPVARQVS